MKKFYKNAEMEIVEFEVEDVITASGNLDVDIPTIDQGEDDGEL